MLEKKIKKKSLSDFKVKQSFLIEYNNKRDKLIVICEHCHSSYDYYKQDVCPKCNTKIKDKSLLSFSKDREYQIFSGDALEPSKDIINDFEMHMYCKEKLYSEIVEETDDKIKYVRTYFKGYNLKLSKKLKFYTTPCFRTELIYFDKQTGNIIIGYRGSLYTMDVLNDTKIYYLTTHVKSNLNKYFVNGIVDYIEHQYPMLKRLKSYINFNQKCSFDEKRSYIIDLLCYYQNSMFLQLFENINEGIISFEYIDHYFIQFMSHKQYDKLKKCELLTDYIEYYSGSSKIFDYILSSSFFEDCCNSSVFEYIINVSKLIILSPLFFYFDDNQYDMLFDAFADRCSINYFYVTYYKSMNSIFTGRSYDRSINHFQYVNQYAVKYLCNMGLYQHFKALIFKELIQYNDGNDSSGVAQLLFKFEKIVRLIIPALHYLNRTKQKDVSNILLNTVTFNDFYKESIKYLIRDYALIIEINGVCFLQIPLQSRMPICKNYDVIKLLNIQDIDLFYINGMSQDTFVYIIKDDYLDSLYMVDNGMYLNRTSDFYQHALTRFFRHDQSNKSDNCLNHYLFITNQI